MLQKQDRWKKCSKLVLKIKWVIILLVLAITAFFAYQIPKIRINSDVISSLPDNDPDAVLLKKIGAQFGGNRMGMIILESDNIFTPEVLAHVRQITDSVEEIEGISSVTSLTNIMDIKEGEYGMEIGKLVDENDLPDSPEEFSQLKERVLSKEMYKGSIVSEDGTATIIIFSLFDDADIQTLANAVKEKTEALHLPEHIYYAGSPMMITSIAHLISADLKRLLPIAFLLIAVVLFVGFRSLEGSDFAIAHSHYRNHMGYRHHVSYGIGDEYGFEQYTHRFAGCGHRLCNPCAEPD